MAEGIRSPNIPSGIRLDEFIGHQIDGTTRSTRRVPRDAVLGNIEAVVNSFVVGGGVIFKTLVQALANLNYPANQMAWVIQDTTPANNGIYQKIAASGFGSWGRVGDLPYSFYRALNEGAGTANAIQATNGYPMANKDALIVVNLTADNTASPVTLSLNGGTALTIKTSSGNDIPVGALLDGMMIAGYIDAGGTQFRLLSDIASASIVAAAEAVLADIKTHHLGAFANDTAASASVGDAPEIGTLYFNTTVGKLRVWDSVEWQDWSVTLNNGDVSFLKLSDTLVQTDADSSPDETSDTEIPTVKRVGTLIRNAGGMVLTPFQFGALPDGSDSSAALLEAFAEMESSGKVLDLGPYTWTIGDQLDYTWTAKPKIYGDAATIKLDRGEEDDIECVVKFLGGEVGADFRGWTVDASRQAYNAFWLFNTLGTMDAADIGDVYCEDFGAQNAYRSGTELNGGVGMRFNGGYRSLHLVRPRVKNIKMAEGAGEMSVLGVAGIMINNADVAMARDVVIEKPDIVDVYSEDTSYVYDQDGIVIFSNAPSATDGENGSILISGGTITNCRGRSIKMARVNATVDGTYFKRLSGTGFSNSGFNEIDFQYGDGRARNLRYFHQGNSAQAIIGTTAKNNVTGGLHVENVRGWQSSTLLSMTALVIRTFSGSYPASPVTIRNFSHGGKLVPCILRHSSNKNTTASTDHRETISISDCEVDALGNGILSRAGGAVQAVLTSVVNGGSTDVAKATHDSGSTTIIDSGLVGFT
ncbi:MAG: hypothetical protein WBA48_03515 [Xanthobacteraceae bacterium]